MNRFFKHYTKYICLLLVICTVVCAFGCGGARQPEEVADLFLTHIRDGHMKRAMALLHNPEDFMLGDSFFIDLNEALLAHLSWTLGDKRYDGENNYYMIEADITMVDLAAVMGELMTQYFDQILADAVQGITWEDDDVAAQLTADLNAVITSDDAPLCTKSILIYVVPDPDGDWLVFAEDDLINAVTGGVLELYEFYSYGI